jgi:tRNA(Ile)-lysidine synthase
LPKTRRKRAVARVPRSGRPQFTPAWLAGQLAQLLPGLPRMHLCVAFSGGADSTALLAALAQLRRPGLKVRAVHVDHHLQPGSARWSRHCRGVARQLGVTLKVRNIHVPRRRGESLEAAAREARYAALAAALTDGELLLTAHHADDQLETVLLQLLRGAGIAGIAAMPAVAPFAHTVLVRPLLERAGEELRAWLRSQGIAWVEDDSNADERLDRNYLRLQVLPLLRARWPAAAASVARTARHAAEAQRLLEALGAADAGRAAVGAALSAQVLRTLPAERRRNALRHWIGAAGFLAPPSRRLQEISGALLAARADTQPVVAWRGVRIRREKDLLVLQPGAAPTERAGAPAESSEPPLSWRWQRQRTFALPHGSLTLKTDARGPLDLDALTPQLTLRARRGGERLRPVRGGPRRALKGLLQEARIPVEERARLPLLFGGERLLAVADLWQDESVQAGPGSRRRGRLIWRATH